MVEASSKIDETQAVVFKIAQSNFDAMEGLEITKSEAKLGTEVRICQDGS